MGCGASQSPEVVATSVTPTNGGNAEIKTTQGGSAFTVTSHQEKAQDRIRPKKGNFLPFVRFDKSAVAPEISSGDEIYLLFTYSGIAIEGSGARVIAEDTELKHSSVFKCIFAAGGKKILEDGDSVYFQHVQSGLYLEAASDIAPLTLAHKNPNSSGQKFGFYKQGRPLSFRHRDTVYIESWLNFYVEEKFNADETLWAKRWQRREPQTITVLKKAVLDSSTTELARKFQFQAFDLDGNGSISKAEMDQMICLVRGQEVPAEEIEGIFAEADPACTGKIPYQTFAQWADRGGLSEEQLQHIEVLGNIAQRCNDALHDEAALIEVLGTIDSTTTQDMVGKYAQRLRAGNVTEAILAKAARESDGWFFSGNWKNAMSALLESEVDLWCRCLNDAMRGLGTDEDSLTALVCTLPERLREPIFERYQERFGKSLLDHIKSETSFSYKKVMVWQTMAPEECRAQILNDAMVGLGTDEAQLIRVICQLNFGERGRVKETYLRMFGRDLIGHIESETSGDFKKSLKCMLEAEESEFNLDADCAAMKAAMDGWGTDEEVLIRLICSKTAKQMEDVNAKFEQLYNRSLLDRVKSETSGHFQATLIGCIRHPMVQLAHTVRDCMAGWGTWDTGLITCLVHLEDFKKTSLIKMYQQEFKRDLLKDIKSDTSGDYQRALCALVKPAPVVWAEALLGAMKGMGTYDELLINFIVLAKDEMYEVRKAFHAITGKLLEDWIESDCSGDYQKTLIMIAGRNSEDRMNLMPVYWAQRTLDAIHNVDTVKDLLVSMPSVAIRRHTQLYEAVYGKSLREEIKHKTEENSSWFSFSNYWKTAMMALMDMPVELIVRGLWDAMHGWGTDEYTLTGLVCTLPENLYDEIHGLYEKLHKRKLVDHIESETSFAYKKCLKYQAMPWAESRATALYGAMAGWGTSEDQLIRVVICSTMREREKIKEAYQKKFDKDLITHIESETSGSFKNILVAVLRSTQPRANVNYDKDCEKLKKAMDGFGTDEQAIIKVVAGKTPEQIEMLKHRFEELYAENLVARIDDETWDWGTSIFFGANFRQSILGLLRPPIERLAYAVRDCIVGFGTDDTGLITLLVHLSERQRRDLVSTFAEIKGGGDLYRFIAGDTSGDYKRALLALVKPPPQVWAEALHGAMAGLGTSDNLLINWMCISKERMDEVREAFAELYDGQNLARWIAGECSGDYKDTLIRLANRRCPRFSGQEVGLSMEPPASKEEALVRFATCFNRLCKDRKKKGSNIVPSEEDQQEMGNAFLYYGSMSSCAPNLDVPGLWDLTNAVGFPPADDGPDLIATFREWNYSGTGEITWNDFVREMTTRINDPNHFNAEPLPDTPDELRERAWTAYNGSGLEFEERPESDDEEDHARAPPPPVAPHAGHQDMMQAFRNGTWKDVLRDVEPEAPGGRLDGLWGDCLAAAVRIEHTDPGFCEGAAGMVIEYLQQLGHDPYIGPADVREQEEHARY